MEKIKYSPFLKKSFFNYCFVNHTIYLLLLLSCFLLFFVRNLTCICFTLFITSIFSFLVHLLNIIFFTRNCYITLLHYLNTTLSQKHQYRRRKSTWWNLFLKNIFLILYSLLIFFLQFVISITFQYLSFTLLLPAYFKITSSHTLHFLITFHILFKHVHPTLPTSVHRHVRPAVCGVCGPPHPAVSPPRLDRTQGGGDTRGGGERGEERVKRWRVKGEENREKKRRRGGGRGKMKNRLKWWLASCEELGNSDSSFTNFVFMLHVADKFVMFHKLDFFSLTVLLLFKIVCQTA